jgi:DNA polymerase-3 subunit beta
MLKVKVYQAGMAKALAICGETVSKRNVLPVLACVLLKGEGGRLAVRSTNLEEMSCLWIDALVSEEGAIALDARLLSDWVNAVKGGVIEIAEQAGSKASLKCGRNTATMKGNAGSEFPLMDASEPTVLQRVTAGDFCERVERAAFAASTDDSRPSMSSVRMELSDGVRLVATDGYRLSIAGARVDEPAGAETRCLLAPTAGILAVAAVAGLRKDALLEIGVVRDSLLSFQMELHTVDGLQEAQVLVNTVDAKYPDVWKIVPKEHTARVRVDTAEMQRALRVCSWFTADKKVQLEVGEDKIVLCATSSEVGENTVEVPAVVEGGVGLVMRFNVHYLLEAVAGAGTPSVVFEAKSAETPGVLHLPAEGEGYLHVLMPMVK